MAGRRSSVHSGALHIAVVRGNVVEIRPVQSVGRRRGEQQALDIEAGSERGGQQHTEPAEEGQVVIGVDRHEP